jgi:CubicO group peptidase (beta-lactamase class C family)
VSPTTDPASETRRALDGIIRRHHSIYRLPGVAASVVAHGDVIWQAGMGRPRLGSPAPVGSETVFRAGSITKLMTALAVMRLRERGALSLDDPVVRHLPEFPDPSITVRQLMSHSSGIQREFADPSREVPADGVLVTTEDLRSAEFFFPPGVVWKYSNFGYATLGEIVRRIVQSPFREFVSEEVLAPLGMSNTTFDRPVDADVDLAHGHQRIPHGGGVELDPAMFDAVSDATGQLYTTARDLSRLASVFAGTRSDSPVANASVLEMERPVVMLDESWSGGHGSGPMLIRDEDLVMAGHGGEVGGFAGWVLASPANGVGAAALTNLQDAAPLLAMLKAMIPAALQVPPATEPVGSPAAPAEVSDTLGEYFGDGSLARLVWREGRLWCEWPRDDDLHGPGPAPLIRTAPDVYRFGRGGLYDGEPLMLERDATGRVSGLSVCSYRYRRI